MNMLRTKRDDVGAVSLLDEPARRRLYDWVVSQGRPVGREEAAKAVKITRSLATFHLDRLAEAGLLEAGYRRLSGKVGPGAGRPARGRSSCLCRYDQRCVASALTTAVGVQHPWRMQPGSWARSWAAIRGVDPRPGD